ncbi:unnamed protein product [Schistosoma curassoni]|uniref:Reverse transcriptase domain-containing protein n=1 Tax=Schistosoma curassoni TaxID=6186 RepID=A0A183KEG2_9TREM|nr:unnamed protein product [Schistosoma curassoni]
MLRPTGVEAAAAAAAATLIVVEGSQQENLVQGFVLLGTRYQGVPVILRKLVLPGGFDLVSPSFTIWDEEQVPTDWKEGLLVKIPKKGDLSKCDKYRGITLLSIPGKVFNRVLLNRMKDSVDAQLRDQQAGFRKDRSCTDQIATLRIIVEQSIEWNSSLYINFIDYEKAFDRVDRITLWKLLQYYGVTENIVNIIRNSNDGLNCKIVHGRQLTDSMIDEHGGSDADVKARIGIARTAYLQLENIWNSKQLSSSQHRGRNFQYECEDSSTVWCENSEKYESYHAEDTSSQQETLALGFVLLGTRQQGVPVILKELMLPGGFYPV